MAGGCQQGDLVQGPVAGAPSLPMDGLERGHLLCSSRNTVQLLILCSITAVPCQRCRTHQAVVVNQSLEALGMMQLQGKALLWY